MRALAALGLVILLGGGCQTMTGRSAGQWADDRAVTARVKARLVAAGVATLTRVHVDTWNGTVYLTGGVDTPELKRLAEMVARGLPSVQLVVNNLHVSADPGSADDAPAASVAWAGGAAHAALARATGLVRLEPDTGTPAWTRYAAYDRAGRQAATVYLVPAATLVREGVGDLPADHRVGRLAIHPDPAGGRYYVVLWRPDDATVRPDR